MNIILLEKNEKSLRLFTLPSTLSIEVFLNPSFISFGIVNDGGLDNSLRLAYNVQDGGKDDTLEISSTVEDSE